MTPSETIAAAQTTLSPIKFQADMGILLAFMRAGTLVLMPAFACFLLDSAGPHEHR